MLEQKRIDETTNSLSRRDFLVKAGALTAGMAVAGGILGSAVGGAEAAMLTSPLTYKKLDPEHCRKWGLEGYKGVATDWTGASVTGAGCCFGAAYGLLKELWTNGSDANWQTISPTWWGYGGGGINSWGTLCGAVNGAGFVLNLALGHNPAGGTADICYKSVTELMNWYSRMPFPSPSLIDGTLTDDKFVGKHLTSTLDVRKVTSVSGSPLCHVSVSTWIKAVQDKAIDAEPAAGVQRATVNGNAKSDRCARLTGDVAAKAAVILNQILANRINFVGYHTTATNFCLDCHNGGAMTANYTDNAGMANSNNVQGMMACDECHDHENAGQTAGLDHNSFHLGNDDCTVCHK